MIKFDPKVGDLYRVRTVKKGSKLGRVTRVAGEHIMLRQIDNDGQDFYKETKKTIEMFVIMAHRDDLIKRMEMDNFYGMVVPFGTAKIHAVNVR